MMSTSLLASSEPTNVLTPIAVPSSPIMTALVPREANMICAPVILATQAMFTIAPSMIAERKFLLVRAHRQPSTKCVGNGTTEVPWAQTATTA